MWQSVSMRLRNTIINNQGKKIQYSDYVIIAPNQLSTETVFLRVLYELDIPIWLTKISIQTEIGNLRWVD